MADVHSPEQRSKNMSAIKGVNTTPEVKVRRLLHSKGYRFRLHKKDLPGRPDIVLPRHNVAIFVNGCFWHQHECHLFRWPETRAKFWEDKLAANRIRDENNYQDLRHAGWRVVIIWECAIKGKYRLSDEQLETLLTRALQSEESLNEVSHA